MKFLKTSLLLIFTQPLKSGVNENNPDICRLIGEIIEMLHEIPVSFFFSGPKPGVI